MRTAAHFKGHAVHQMLIPLPLGLLLGAFAFDVLGALLDRPAFQATAAHLIPAGILAGVVAAVPGLLDYLRSVPPRSSAKARATKHMLANGTALGLFAVAWAVRGSADAGAGAPALAVELLAVAALGAGGWMGGTLVNRNFIGPEHRYAGAGRWTEASVRAAPGESVRVAAANELRVDQMKLVRVNGRRVVVARTEDGWAAFDDGCTHRGGSLADGVLVCGTVQCLWHGSQFDTRTGAVKAGPAEEPIATYAVEERGGEIRLTL